jgi:hypothetical protein
VTLSVRRWVAVLAAGAALVMAGCGGPAGPDRAAVVDGRVISESALTTTQSQLNSLQPSPFQQKLTPQTTLQYLIQAPTVIETLNDKGVVVSESVATKLAQQLRVQDPSEGTVAVIQSLAGLSTAQNNGQWTAQDQSGLTDKLSAQAVTVNPRYGTFDPKAPAVTLTSPAWVKPFDAAQ